MNLFIPACGDRIILTADWSFDLYLESRNLKFAESQKLFTPNGKSRWNQEVWEGESYRSPYKRVRPTLVAGDVLECDRVYIRTFSKSALEVGNDFDSITWKLVKNNKAVRSGRFWVKLPDCYNIEYKLEEDSLYQDRVKLVRSVQEALGDRPDPNVPETEVPSGPRDCSSNDEEAARLFLLQGRRLLLRIG